jgi:4-hydroxy-tetrahydrodipicolinate reductase
MASLIGFRCDKSGEAGDCIRKSKKRNCKEENRAMIRICLAGATGWAGSELARAIAASSSEIVLISAVSRRSAGQTLGAALGNNQITTPVFATALEALDFGAVDVFVEYTKPDVAKHNVITAIQHGAHVVIGASGLTSDDLAEIDGEAKRGQRGVLAVGNFALTAVLLLKFAELAAKLIPHWEIIDYAHDDKVDAPSGTVRELAARMARARQPEQTISVDQSIGEREARGATLNGGQVHSLRLPGYVISAEAIFGMPDQRLSIRHDSGSSAKPYVDGALLAIRKVAGLIGVHRGLDAVLDL